MRNFWNESWIAILVLLAIIASGYGAMILLIKLGGY
jgi:hypothetical protein